MPCYRPQPAYQFYYPHTDKWSKPKLIYPSFVNVDKSRVFRAPKFGDYSDISTKKPFYRNFTVPCGVCFGCRIENARHWSLRMMHETRYHEKNYFITLTYNDASLPTDADLNYKHLQDFFKRARHEFQTLAKPFKYFACGEYGDKTLRPHYHFAGFDFSIPDLRPFKNTRTGWYYTSDALSDVWGHGHCIVGSLTWFSAAYIARYVTKKMNGKNVRDRPHDPETGEIFPYTIERAFQSKGLGLPFYLEHQEEIWNLDACLFNKYLVKPPRYYFKQLQAADPDRALAVMARRQADKEQYYHLDEARDKELLYAMEATRLQMQTLKREL